LRVKEAMAARSQQSPAERKLFDTFDQIYIDILPKQRQEECKPKAV